MSSFPEFPAGGNGLPLQLAPRLHRVAESASVAIADRARAYQAAGRQVINLAVGEPDFATPIRVKAAAVEALFAEKTKYTKVDGTDDLKAAIARKLRRDSGLEYEPAEIIATTGAKQAIFNAMLALVEAGTEVVIPAPYWLSFPEMVLVCGGEPVIVPTRMEDGFKLTAETLAAAISPRTRLLILNSPSNPTGAVYSRGELAGLAVVLRDNPHVLVLSDDIYEYIRWDGGAFHNLASACPDLKPRVIVVNGVSKSHAMTGWRIGYAAGPAEVIGAMRSVQSHSTSNPCSIAQHAAAAALAMDRGSVMHMVHSFRQRHDDAVARLDGLCNVRCIPAAGAFFVFPDFGRVIAGLGLSDDVELAERLIEDHGVAVVPGTAYGAPGHLRLSVAASQKDLREGLDVIGLLARAAAGRR